MIDAPRAALRRQILQERLKPVHGVGETRFGRLVCLEFLPQRAESRAGGLRQQAEQAVGGAPFAIGPRLVPLDVVGERVFGVNFH